MEKTLYSIESAVLRDWLRDQRVAADLTTRALGERLKVPHQFISKIEKGDRRLDVIEYVVYCKALGCDPHVGLAEIEGSV